MILSCADLEKDPYLVESADEASLIEHAVTKNYLYYCYSRNIGETRDQTSDSKIARQARPPLVTFTETGRFGLSRMPLFFDVLPNWAFK